MTAPEGQADTFLTVYESIPDEWNDAQEFLTEQLREITNGVNDRDVGIYFEDIYANGQKWQPSSTALSSTDTPAEPRTVFRKVIDLGGLPNFASTDPKQVTHGITTSANFCITRLYGAASDPGASTLTAALPLPFVDAGGTAHIGLTMDATNININGDGTTDYSAYTCAWVVVEWINEA